MSTKTSIKRIALVAVSALGLGVLTSVAPANAAATDGTLTATQITSGRLGAPVVIKVSHLLTTDSSVGGNDTATIRVKLLTSAPNSSTKTGDDVLFHDWSSNNLQSKPRVVASAGGDNIAADAAITVDNDEETDSGADDGNNQILFDCSNTSTACSASTEYVLTAFASFVPDKAGTWNLVFWSDADDDGVLDAAEKTSNVSVVVTDSAIKSVTVTSFGTAPTTASSTAEATAENGLMKISLKGSDDLPALPTTSEYLTATVSAGAMYLNKLNDASATYSQYVRSSTTAIGETGGSGITSLNLNYYNFDIYGNAYVDVMNATEETASLTVTVGGTSITGSANQAFLTASDDAHADGILCKVTTTAGCLESATTDPAFSIGAGSKSVTYYIGTSAAEAVAAVDVTDTFGLITGLIGGNFSLAVTGSDTAMTAAEVAAIGFATTSFLGSFAIASASGSETSGTYAVRVENNASQTATVVASTGSTGALYVNGVAKDTVRAAKGSTNSIVFRCTDSLGGRKANATVSLSLTGRNSGLVTLPTLVTNASGEATLSYTDASTSTTTSTDTISFTAGSCTDTAYFTYYATSDLGVSTVAWSAGGAYDESYAGATTHNIQADDDVSTGAQSVTFIVKDASGVALAGVPVTFTVDNGFIKKTSTVDYATQITGADGKVSTSIFATAPGKQTVTATVGTKTATGYVNWIQEEENDARSISADVTGNKVTFTVKDRLGNGVRYVDITVTTNDGWFGNGSTSTTPATDENGVAIVYLSGNTNEATVKGTLARASYPQAYDVAGEIAETAVTAATAGTTTGYGASSAAAGVGVATASVNADTKSSDSVDAANEATDAANAATDAANAAAEAADAATAAAQDAQAAVAALATEVAAMISGIKAQIIRLTNLVVKIQKKVNA